MRLSRREGETVGIQIDFAPLKRLVFEFRDARAWERFHDSKNLAATLAIEPAKFQELFSSRLEEEVTP